MFCSNDQFFPVMLLEPCGPQMLEILVHWNAWSSLSYATVFFVLTSVISKSKENFKGGWSMIFVGQMPCIMLWNSLDIRAAANTRVVNYSSNFWLLEYSLISISGCKFPFPVAVFCSQLTILPPSVQRVASAGQKTSKLACELLEY